MNPKPTVYLETTIPSYLCARPSENLIQAAKQLVTRKWWDTKRLEYHLVFSQFVLEEAGRGDPEASKRRLGFLKGCTELALDDAVKDLYSKMLKNEVFPRKASVDAAHLAVCVVHRVDILLTWNCKHLANADLFSRLRCFMAERGYGMPVICTPFEILGENHDD